MCTECVEALASVVIVQLSYRETSVANRLQQQPPSFVPKRTHHCAHLSSDRPDRRPSRSLHEACTNGHVNREDPSLSLRKRWAHTGSRSLTGIMRCVRCWDANNTTCCGS